MQTESFLTATRIARTPFERESEAREIEFSPSRSGGFLHPVRDRRGCLPSPGVLHSPRILADCR